MTDSEFTDAVWRALWASMSDGADPGEGPHVTAEELKALLAAASRLPPDKLRILLKAIRAAVEH